MYLVIGGSGFLGRYIIKNILEMTGDDIVATYSSTNPTRDNARVHWSKLDVCDRNQIIELKKHIKLPVKIIYCAAYHHPDKVEENPLLAWDSNIVALANFINIFDDAQCFYYSSTDTVYGEGSTATRFLELDSLKPVNLYGQHKVLAEQITLTKGFNVVRFPFIFGTSLVEGKKHFFDLIKSDLESNKIVDMFNDSFRSTLDFNQCAKLLIMLIEKYGSASDKIINISGDDILSKYEVALLMAEKYNLNASLINPVSILSTVGVFKAKRASTAILDNTKLKALLNLPIIKLVV